MKINELSGKGRGEEEEIKIGGAHARMWVKANYTASRLPPSLGSNRLKHVAKFSRVGGNRLDRDIGPRLRDSSKMNHATTHRLCRVQR